MFLLGAGLGNAGILIISPIPLLFLIAGRHAEPARPRITTRVSTTTPRRGETVTVDIHVASPPGEGLLEIHAPFPSEFDLEAGSNLHVVPAVPEGRGYALRYRFRASKRGRHTIPAVAYARIHALGFTGTLTGEGGSAIELDVQPPVKTPRRGFSRLRAAPASSSARVIRGGVAGSLFSEVREYRPGDALKRINWKATARRLASGANAKPLVNEYEREGRSAAWILVDASASRLEIGTSADNALERALEAAAETAAAFLGEGTPVGGLAYHARGAHPVAPDSGKEHAARLARALARAHPVRDDEPDGLTLKQALTLSRPYLAKGGARMIIFTRVTSPTDELAAGLREARRLFSREAAPVVIDVRPWGLEPPLPRGDDAAAAIDALNARARAEVRALGARVIPWYPAKEAFKDALARIERAHGGPR